jgi:uncharacterized surface protein with fasciclin (FAS1) repeats
MKKLNTKYKSSKPGNSKKGFRMKPYLLLAMVLVLITFACKEDWDAHYTPTEETVNMNVWEAIQQEANFSLFADFLLKNGLDTILGGNQQYTLFIPTNDAFNAIPDTVEITAFLMNHLISPNVVNIRYIETSKQLQTLSGKFALIQNVMGTYYFDDVEVTDRSPLFLNGRYYELNQMPVAKPNIQEYFNNFLPVMANYVSMQVYDSLDKSLSTPIGFDEDGNTIYDSVFITISPFEEKYFPISEESRENYATFVLFSQEQYNSALDEMAEEIGGVYTSHKDIPASWQTTTLLPSVLDNGIFENRLSYEQLADPNLLNINGQPVTLDVNNVNTESAIPSSNGLLYGFYDFSIADSLYLGEARIEGESLVDSIGSNKYAWKEDVIVSGEIFEPIATNTEGASGNKCLVVSMGRSFSGNFSIEIKFRNIFPGRHRLEWRANYRPSGAYKIFVNDEELAQYDTYNLRNPLISVTGEIYRPTSAGLNTIDFWVENLTEYGDVSVRFEYLGSGDSNINGLFIDYVSLVPESQ